jgi:hypothetical protein
LRQGFASGETPGYLSLLVADTHDGWFAGSSVIRIRLFECALGLPPTLLATVTETAQQWLRINPAVASDFLNLFFAVGLL